MMTEFPAIIKANSCFELPTYQRRLRHLKSIAIRNLSCPGCRSKDVGKLQTYFSLHKDSKSQGFYISEKIIGSLNPSWQSFDISRHEKDIDTKSKSVRLKVWVGVEGRFMLLLDWQVNLAGLVFAPDKPQETMKYASNTVIFGMFDKFFMAPDVTEHVKGDKKEGKSKRESKKSKKKIEKHSIFLQVDQSIVRSSYTSSSLSRIHTVLRAIKQNQASVNKIHQSIDDRLLSSHEKTQKLSSQEELLLKVSQLKSELRWKMSKLQSEQDESAKLTSANQNKRKAMEDKLSALQKEKELYLERLKAYNQTRESLIKESAQLWIRRKQLINELATYIYPINENKRQVLMICNVRLPDSEDFQGQDENMIAVALGYTSHFTMMISHVLDIPLRFPMEHRGSRSLISDHIHTKLADKDREFPLYGKGKEKFQFNYGVFLLNKNISQLRFCCGLGTTDLRTTLKNIKSLLELRLGVKMENANWHSLSGNLERERSIHELERTDGHSSIASGGRYSLPGSAEAPAYDSILLPSKNSNRKKDTDHSSNASIPDPLSVDPSQTNLNGESDDLFQPMDGDSFFRISSPPAERLGVLNDIGAIQEECSIKTDKKVEVELPSRDSDTENSDRTLATTEDQKSTSYILNSDTGVSDVVISVKLNSDQNETHSNDIDRTVNSVNDEQKHTEQTDSGPEFPEKLENCHTFVDTTYFKTTINQLDDPDSDSLSDSADLYQL